MPTRYHVRYEAGRRAYAVSRTSASANSKRFTAIVAICVSLILMTLGCGAWFIERHNHETAYKAAEGNLRQASLVVESTVNHLFLQVDGALASLPAVLAATGADTDRLDARRAARLLRSFNFQTFAFRDLMLVQTEGSIWASARPGSWNRHFPVSLLATEQAALRGAAAVLGPVKNPATGEWVAFIVHQLELPAVGPLWAVAEVPLPLISNLLAAVSGTPGLQVSLERHDGELLVSQPYNETLMGKRQPLVVSSSQANGQPFAGPAATGTPLLAVARSSLYADVIFVLTLNLDVALSDWARDRNRLLIFLTSFGILICAMALTLDIAHRQRERAGAERDKAREMLDSAIESMSDGFVMWDRNGRLIMCNEQFRRMYEQKPAVHCAGHHIRRHYSGGCQARRVRQWETI